MGARLRKRSGRTTKLVLKCSNKKNIQSLVFLVVLVLGSVPVRCYGIANIFLLKIHVSHNKIIIL